MLPLVWHFTENHSKLSIYSIQVLFVIYMLALLPYCKLVYLKSTRDNRVLKNVRPVSLVLPSFVQPYPHTCFLVAHRTGIPILSLTGTFCGNFALMLLTSSDRLAVLKIYNNNKIVCDIATKLTSTLTPVISIDYVCISLSSPLQRCKRT